MHVLLKYQRDQRNVFNRTSYILRTIWCKCTMQVRVKRYICGELTGTFKNRMFDADISYIKNLFFRLKCVVVGWVLSRLTLYGILNNTFFHLSTDLLICSTALGFRPEFGMSLYP